jgi:hypothetical protein
MPSWRILREWFMLFFWKVLKSIYQQLVGPQASISAEMKVPGATDFRFTLPSRWFVDCVFNMCDGGLIVCYCLLRLRGSLHTDEVWAGGCT